MGEAYSDQLTRNGHRTRLDDLDRFADLGLRTLRYPVLWEHVAPDSLDRPDWQWADERLGRLQELAIEPIVGLVHHGSGPRYTALDQPTFAPGLARYARLVAERYPWVKYYTPVNEPLTTARFSGLYGLWYPHGCDDRTFVRVLLNELLATKLAMLAIWEEYDVVHYCVPNIASRVPRTATNALSNIFTPILQEISQQGGINEALFTNEHFRSGVYIYKGSLTNAAIAKKFNMRYKELGLLIAVRN